MSEVGKTKNYHDETSSLGAAVGIKNILFLINYDVIFPDELIALLVQLSRALHRYRRGYGVESDSELKILSL